MTRDARAVWFGCFAMLVSYLPLSGANGILGAIGTATGASTSDLQWLTDAFSVALAGTVLSAGMLGDRFGHRRVARTGLALTAAGTAIGFGAGGTVPGELLWLGPGAGRHRRGGGGVSPPPPRGARRPPPRAGGPRI